MDAQRPIPFPSADAAPYWEAAKAHRLLLPFCNSCQKFFFYPRPFCPRDFSWAIEWKEASGRGILHAYTIIHRPLQPGFDAPYTVALVEVEDQVKLMTNLSGIEPDPNKISIGMDLVVEYLDLNDSVTIPVFRPADGATGA